MISDLQTITARIDALFVPKAQTRYWLQIVNDPYDQTYNFFFNHQKKWMRMKSIPLHTVTTYHLNYLETLVQGVQQHTKLTIEYEGFVGMTWPHAQRPIQRRRHKDE